MPSGERTPNDVRARALAELVLGREKPGVIAKRYGVTTAILGRWRRELATDAELTLATNAAIRVLLEAWRPAVRRLLTRMASNLDTLLETRPESLDPTETVGAIRALAEMMGQADALAARAGADDDDPAAILRRVREERRLDS